MENLEESLAELRQTFKSGKTRSVEWRKTQLRALLDLVRENEEKIFGALNQDLGKHPVEAYRDEVSIYIYIYLLLYSFSIVCSVTISRVCFLEVKDCWGFYQKSPSLYSQKKKKKFHLLGSHLKKKRSVRVSCRYVCVCVGGRGWGLRQLFLV